MVLYGIVFIEQEFEADKLVVTGRFVAVTWLELAGYRRTNKKWSRTHGNVGGLLQWRSIWIKEGRHLIIEKCDEIEGNPWELDYSKVLLERRGYVMFVWDKDDLLRRYINIMQQ